MILNSPGGLVDSHVVDEQEGREVLAHLAGYCTGTLLLPAVEAVAGTACLEGTRCGEAPRAAYCSVEQ